MRWTRMASRVPCACGRTMPARTRSRVVLTPRRWCQAYETMSSCAMGARKPGPQGERDISVKTIAQGMPDDSAEPVVTAASFSFCWRAMGCGQHPAFPAPSAVSRATRDASLGHFVPREHSSMSLRCGSYLLRCGSYRSAVMPRFKRGIQYSRDAAAYWIARSSV